MPSPAASRRKNATHPTAHGMGRLASARTSAQHFIGGLGQKTLPAPQLTLLSAPCQDAPTGGLRLHRLRPEPTPHGTNRLGRLREGRHPRGPDRRGRGLPQSTETRVPAADRFRGARRQKLVLAVVNFPPRQIANFFSEVLTLGVV